ncbi:MAG: hypothetical protein Q9214_002428 [Letrouitia sp. 1 TL-2023]
MADLASKNLNIQPPGSDSLLQTYVDEISLAAATITTYCTSNPLLQPNSQPGQQSVLIPLSAPPKVQDARQRLIASAARIQQVVTEPTEYLPNLAIHVRLLFGAYCPYSCCIVGITTILPAIPQYGLISYSDLAETTHVPESQLRSVVRMAMTSNFLCQPSADSVAHNSVSRLFISNSGFIDWINFMTQFSAPTAAAFAEATEKWGTTDKKNQTAFNVASRTDEPLFDFFARSPKSAKQFASYMKSVQSSHGTSLNHLLTGYDWEGLGEAVVVDVGGSTCSSSVALAEAFPRLQFVVQDLPSTISNSSALLSSQPDSLRSRITTQNHDFFTPQPLKDASVYLLRMILHDWPFAESILILKNHIGALKANPKARLVIMDTVLPDQAGSIGVVEEALLRVRDLAMIQTFNSKERELGEFVELFMQARDEDGCLVLERVTKPPGSLMSVMEVRYRTYKGEETMTGATKNSTAFAEPSTK